MTPKRFITGMKSKIQNPKSKVRSSCPPGESTFSEEDIIASRFRVTKVLPFQQASPPFLNNLWLAIASGVLLILAFPNWNLWSLGWVGVAPLLMAVAREQKFWRSFWLGLTTGVIFYAGSSPWITHSMHHYGGMPMWVCYLVLVLIAVILSSFTALFAGVLGYTIKSFGGWAILSAPVLWTASEWLRLQITGMGWHNLGYSQAFQPTLIQISRFGGVYLVSGFLISMSAAVVFSLIYLGYRRGWIVFSIAALLAITILSFGTLRTPPKPQPGSLNFLVVQPNIPIDGNWGDEDFEAKMTLRHITLSEQALDNHKKEAPPSTDLDNDLRSAGGRIDLIIWPESPMNFHYERDEKLRKRLAEFTMRNKVYLLISSWGIPPEGSNAEANTNSVLLIAPSGELISRYDKIALMPFGEYVPARGWIPFMNRIPALVADVVAGKNFILQEVADTKIGTMICFEITRPDMARRFRNEGASVFVQLSNESWFGRTSAARQVLAQTVFRAVENNIELIRVTNSGLSAQVTSFGEVIGETPMFETATRVWSANSVADSNNQGVTFYTRYGDIFAITCTALSAIFAIAAIVYERLKKKEEEE